MSSSDQPFHLWIASNDDEAVVALCRLKVSGRPLVHKWGSITDLRAIPSTLADPAMLNPSLLGFLAVLAAGVLCAGIAGAPLVIFILVAVAIIAAITTRAVNRETAGKIIAPDLRRFPEIHRLLDTPEEREDFLDLIELAERVGRTLPALDGLIDPADTGETLAQALWDGAKLLARRKDIRLVLEDLDKHDLTGLPSTSRVVQDLMSQRDNARSLWDQVNGELTKLKANFDAAAQAGENFIREHEASEAARRAEKALGEIVSQEPPAESFASEQLADETVAVVKAHRDLIDLYGGA